MKSKRLPRGFRRGHDDSIACKHRNMSCCAECAAAHVEMVDVLGQHYWIPDPVERAAVLADLAETEKRRAAMRAGAGEQ